MTEGALAFTVDPSSLTAQCAAFFRARVDQWIDGKVLADRFGYGGFRSRISDCRKQFGMVIESRVRRIPHADGTHHKVSSYRFRAN